MLSRGHGPMYAHDGSPALSPVPTEALGWLPERLGRYQVQSLLGAGAVGCVFRAVDQVLNRTVAIKALKPSLAVDPLARQQFLQEARAVASVRDDHVVPI